MAGMRPRMTFRDWCVRCRAYVQHVGYAEGDSPVVVLGACVACKTRHP